MPSYEPSDPFDDIDEGDQRSTSAPFKQLRDHAKKLEKELKDRDKELESLRDFKAQSEARARRDLLEASASKVGITQKQAELFQAVRPDEEPTPEAVKTFAIEYGFVDAGPAADEGEGADGSFAPTPPAGIPASKKRYSSEEFDQLLKVNPVEAMAAATEGRVDFQTKL
ncbi:MAG TPA: hypothetical protein VLA89_06440 [Gemmatimonadales bacterium]|nr:hypothetical protein [Gemmatimonadales bacterium]